VPAVVPGEGNAEDPPVAAPVGPLRLPVEMRGELHLLGLVRHVQDELRVAELASAQLLGNRLEQRSNLVVPAQVREPVRGPQPLRQPLLRQAAAHDVEVDVTEDGVARLERNDPAQDVEAAHLCRRGCQQGMGTPVCVRVKRRRESTLRLGPVVAYTNVDGKRRVELVGVAHLLADELAHR
jgi:hypothetical protein